MTNEQARLLSLPPAPDAIELRHLRAFVAVAEELNVTLELYPVTAHVFHLFWSFLQEAADALERVGQFIGQVSEKEERAV